MLAMERTVTGHDSGDHAAIGHPGPPVDIVAFEPWHLMELRLQASQVNLSYTLTVEHGESLRLAGPCYTAMAGMDVLACAGVVEFWQGRSQAWALLSGQFAGHVKDIHRAVRLFLQSYEVARLECVVDPRNEQAIRWAKHLGFSYESIMPKYTPNGETQNMMVRLQQ